MPKFISLQEPMKMPRFVQSDDFAAMRHKSYSTTQQYINMATRLNESAAKLHVSEFLQAAGQ